MTDIIGLTAAILTSLAFLPQAIKTYKSKSAGDLSLAMFLIFITGLILWLTYGILKNDLPIILSNIITLFLAGSILFFKIKDIIKAKKNGMS